MSETQLIPLITAHLRKENDFVLTTELLKVLQESNPELDRKTLNRALYTLERQKILVKKADANGSKPSWNLKSDLNVAEYRQLLQTIITAAQEELKALGEENQL